MRAAGQDLVRLVRAGQGEAGAARLVPAGFGWARHCVASPGWAWQAGQGASRLGRARLGQVRLGAARLGMAGTARLGRARHATVWHGAAGVAI